jgi:quinol monooxygenase YgiN
VDRKESPVIMPTPVAVIIRYQAHPDRVTEAIAELDGLIATVVATEEDCFGIRLLQDPVDPAAVLLYEEWSSQEAYLGPHFQTPHLGAFRERASFLFSGSPTITFWVQRSDHTPRRVRPEDRP